jgi:hypothetical protein
MDEDIRTGFLVGCGFVSIFFVFFAGLHPTIPGIILVFWIYTIFGADKYHKKKQRKINKDI